MTKLAEVPPTSAGPNHSGSDSARLRIHRLLTNRDRAGSKGQDDVQTVVYTVAIVSRRPTDPQCIVPRQDPEISARYDPTTHDRTVQRQRRRRSTPPWKLGFAMSRVK